MAKVTSKWSESIVFERTGKRFVEKHGVYEAHDIPNIIGAFQQIVIEKRVQEGYELLKKRVERLSETLFTLVANYIGNKGMLYPPTTEIIYPRLSRAYRERKNSERFWLYKGILRDWLLQSNNKPSKVFGIPRIVYARNPNARARQWATIQIEPYPNTKSPNFQDENIRNRLFGRRLAYGKYQSNEELRPLLSPIISGIIKNRLIPVMQNTIKEAVENG